MLKKKNDNNIIWNFVENNTALIFFIIVTLLAFVVRVLVLERTSADFSSFLNPWFETFKASGGLPGLAKEVGNYPPIYMTILALLTYLPIKSIVSIKIVSIIFDFVGALAIKRIVEVLLSDKKYKEKVSLLAYALYLFLPTVFFNSAYWAQCDGIYTSFVLISILYLMKKNYKRGIIFWAIALAFKFQAIFIFPLYVLMYIADHQNFKFRYFFFIPLIIFVMSIPKVIYSHDLLSGFKVYLEQAGTYDMYITLNLPNIYSIFLGREDNIIYTPFHELGTVAIIFTFIILVILAYIVYTKKIKFDKKAIIEFGLFSILIMTFLLPQMHDRYLFMGDVLALVYVVMNIKRYYIAIMIESVSLYAYTHYLFGGPIISFPLVGIVFLITLIIYTKDMYQKYLKIE